MRRRFVFPILSVAMLALAHGGSPSGGQALFPNLSRGVAPDERQALIVGRALWQALVSEEAAKEMSKMGVHKMGEAWLMSACDPRSGTSILDGCAYVVFDSRDGGLFMVSEINPPTKEQIQKALKRRRQAVGMKG